MTTKRTPRTAPRRIRVRLVRCRPAGDQLAWNRALGLRPDRVRIRGGFIWLMSAFSVAHGQSSAAFQRGTGREGYAAAGTAAYTNLGRKPAEGPGGVDLGCRTKPRRGTRDARRNQK